jgi:predicted RNA-binding protein with PIN domain
MKVIIDAYNVLHQVMKHDHIKEQERKHFINQLTAYAKKRGNAVVVVFDGGPFLFPSTSHHKGMTIIYSGPKDSADMMILRYIKEHAGHAMVLVSSDRELCKAAQYYQVESVDAKDFYYTIMEPEQKNAPRVKEQAIKTGDADSIVDIFMMQTGVKKKLEDIEDPVLDRQSPANKLSKKERKRMHKIKKL